MPARKLFILHIGLPKTGTTALQNVLSRNRAALAAEGACYPTSPGPSVHRLVTALASQRRRDPTEKVYRGLDPSDSIDQFRARFAAEMEALPAGIDRVILSDERLSFMVRRPEEFDELRNFLGQYADEIRVVIYLRKQDSLLASLYSQALRHGDLSDSKSFVKTAEKLRMYDYKAVIRQWGKAFGPENIVPRVYETSGASRFDTADDFLQLPFVNLAKLDRAPASGLNPSISAEGQQVLLAVGKTLQKQTGSERIHGPRWKRIADLVTLVGSGKGWQPQPDEVSTFLQRFIAGNEKIRAQYFPERESLFAESPAPSTNHSAVDGVAIENLMCRAIIAAIDATLALEERLAANAAQVAEHSDDPIRKRATLNRALKLQPDSSSIRLQLINLDLSQSRLKSARGALNSLVQLHGVTEETAALAAQIEEAEAATSALADKAGFVSGPDRAKYRRQLRQAEQNRTQ